LISLWSSCPALRSPVLKRCAQRGSTSSLWPTCRWPTAGESERSDMVRTYSASPPLSRALLWGGDGSARGLACEGRGGESARHLRSLGAPNRTSACPPRPASSVVAPPCGYEGRARGREAALARIERRAVCSLSPRRPVAPPQRRDMTSHRGYPLSLAPLDYYLLNIC